jgi:hypothetical protein
MGSWPLKVIKNEYPAWKKRIEAQNASLGYKIYASNNAEAPVYDLQGMRVGSRTKGLYIQNNKKIFIR